MPLDFSRRPTVSGILVAGLGVALFVYFLQRAGIGDVGDGIRRLGWVFLAVVALGGIRFAVRAAAWITCLDGPHRLTLWQVFQAVVAGDSLSDVAIISHDNDVAIIPPGIAGWKCDRGTARRERQRKQ